MVCCVCWIAGDVVIFCGFGSAHGYEYRSPFVSSLSSRNKTYGNDTVVLRLLRVGQWGSEHERRLVIVNFQSRNLRVARGRESSHLQLKGAAL